MLLLLLELLELLLPAGTLQNITKASKNIIKTAKKPHSLQKHQKTLQTISKYQTAQKIKKNSKNIQKHHKSNKKFTKLTKNTKKHRNRSINYLLNFKTRIQSVVMHVSRDSLSLLSRCARVFLLLSFSRCRSSDSRARLL